MLVQSLIAAILLSAPAAAKQPRITSAYTKLDWEKCSVIHSGQQLEHPENWESRRCAGYAGIPIFWGHDDGRDDIDVGIQNDAGFISGPMHGLSETIEWRLANGRPFAIIYRVESRPADLDRVTWSRLIVETIGEPGKPGCPIAKFDALKPNANIAARRAADAVLTGKVHCIDFDE